MEDTASAIAAHIIAGVFGVGIGMLVGSVGAGMAAWAACMVALRFSSR